jgi:hypothetical protein
LELETLIPVVLGLLTLWLIAVSVILYKIYGHYSRLTDKVRGENLIKVLEKVLHDEKSHAEELTQVKSEIMAMQKDSLKNVQKIGLLRFNPFKETGGEQSFSLSLLNKNDDGIVMTGLHARERTRVYTKPIQDGKSVAIDLSDEEKKAVALALKNKHE